MMKGAYTIYVGSATSQHPPYVHKTVKKADLKALAAFLAAVADELDSQDAVLEGEHTIGCFSVRIEKREDA